LRESPSQQTTSPGQCSALLGGAPAPASPLAENGRISRDGRAFRGCGAAAKVMRTVGIEGLLTGWCELHDGEVRIVAMPAILGGRRLRSSENPPERVVDDDRPRRLITSHAPEPLRRYCARQSLAEEDDI